MFAAALILVLGIQLASAIEECPGNFTAIGTGEMKSCLILSTEREYYVDARSLCSDTYLGFMVTAETQWRRDNLKRFLMENTLDSNSEFIYIGAQEDVDQQTFFWDGYSTEAFWNRLDAEEFPEVAPSWRKGEPDNTNENESCVCPKTDGAWNDCKCVNARRLFICERR